MLSLLLLLLLFVVAIIGLFEKFDEIFLLLFHHVSVEDFVFSTEFELLLPLLSLFKFS